MEPVSIMANDAKEQVLKMATSPTTSQVDDEFSIQSKKQKVHEFDGKCVQCKDIIKNGHAVMCAEVGCKIVLHPGCFGTHMVTVHAIESLPVIIRRDEEAGISRYIIKGELVPKEEKTTKDLGRETIHVIGDEIEEVVPSIEIKNDEGPPGKKPLPKKKKTQREVRSKRVKDRLSGKPVHKDKEEPENTDDSV